MTGQFELFIPYFTLPYAIDTSEGTQHIPTIEAYRKTFDSMHRYYRQRGVNQLERHCFAARFVSDTEIRSTHQSTMMAEGLLIHSPYAVFSITKVDTDFVWRSTFSSYAFTGDKEDEKKFIRAAFPNIT